MQGVGGAVLQLHAAWQFYTGTGSTKRLMRRRQDHSAASTALASQGLVKAENPA